MKKTTPVTGKLDWLAGIAAVLSVAACYGTLLVISILSLLGVSLAVNTGLWAGTIVLFAVLAAAGVALGYRRHCRPGPAILAVAGAALIAWVMFGSFDRVLEVIGFLALVSATIWDWRLKRHDVSLP
jgi:hypothetical protein